MRNSIYLTYINTYIYICVRVIERVLQVDKIVALRSGGSDVCTVN